jgi:hypothetical protein
MSEPFRLVVCTGSDCRKSKGFAKVLELATGIDGSTTVPCQDVCHGPVVGLERGGDIRWYARVRGDRRRVLVAVVRSESGRRVLRSAEVRGRRNVVKRPERRSALVARSTRPSQGH